MAMQRGLILQQKHAYKFFEASNPKTLELRNHNLRCVSPNQDFWIVECGHGRNNKGDLVYKVLGRVTFVENVALTPAAVDALRSQHLCSHDDFQALRAKWKKPNIVGWRVTAAHVLQPSRWLKPGSQEGWLHFRLLDLHLDFELAVVARSEAAILTQLHSILPERAQPNIATMLSARPGSTSTVVAAADVVAHAPEHPHHQPHQPETSASAPTAATPSSRGQSQPCPSRPNVIDITEPTGAYSPVENSPRPRRSSVIDITEPRGAYSPVPEATAEDIADMIDSIDEALSVEPRCQRESSSVRPTGPAEGKAPSNACSAESQVPKPFLSHDTDAVPDHGELDSDTEMYFLSELEAQLNDPPPTSAASQSNVPTPTPTLDPDTEMYFLSELEAQLDDPPPKPATSTTGVAKTASHSAAPTATSAASQSNVPEVPATSDMLEQHERSSASPLKPTAADVAKPSHSAAPTATSAAWQSNVRKVPVTSQELEQPEQPGRSEQSSTSTASTHKIPSVWAAIRDARYAIHRRSGPLV